MRCGFCGHEFAEEEGIRACATCSAGCGKGMIRCPRCNYENPPEPSLVKTLKKILKKND